MREREQVGEYNIIAKMGFKVEVKHIGRQPCDQILNQFPRGAD